LSKKFDVRLIVVGNKVFAFKIDSQSYEETSIDYRAGLELTQKLQHFVYEPPAGICTAAVEMVRHCGLSFGAFDFVITEEDEHVFLELNPNGQWLWLQLATGVRISDAFCDLLIGKDPP